MSFKRPAYAKRDRSEEFASFTPTPRTAAMATGLASLPPSIVDPKVQRRASNAILQSAKGEDCTVRLPGCPGDRTQTIWSHNRHGRAGKGRGIKAIDLNGCYACGAWCDAIYDGQRPPPPGFTREAVELAWYHGHAESLVKLTQKGLI